MESIKKRGVHQHQRDDLSWQALREYPSGGNTERGYSASMSISPLGRLAYCAGANIVIKCLDTFLEQEQFDQHKFPPTAVRFNQKGNWMVSGDKQGSVIVWEVLGSYPIRRRYEHVLTGTIRDICWTADNARMFVCGQGVKEFARALLVDSGSQCGNLSGSTKEVLTIDCSTERPLKVALGGEDHSNQFFSGPPYKLVSSQAVHKGYVNSIKYRKNGDVYVSVGADKSIKLFQGKTGELIGEQALAHTSSILSACWVANQENLLVTCSSDKSVKVWDMSDPSCIQLVQTLSNNHSEPSHNEQLVSVVGIQLEDKLQVVAMSLDGSLHRYSSIGSPEQRVITLAGHQHPVQFICQHLSLMVSVDTHGNIIIHDHPLYPKQSIKLPQFQDLGLSRAFLFSPNHLYLYFINISGSLIRIQTDSLQHTQYKINHKEIIQMVINEESFYVLSHDNSIQQFTIEGEQLVLASSFLAECKASCLDVKTVEGEVIVIVGSQKDYLYLYKEGICIQKTEHFQDVKIVAVKISPNGKQLASADNKHNISLWELASMNCLTCQFTFHNAHISFLSFHQNNQWLLSGSQDKSAIVWNLSTLKKQVTYQELHKGGILSGYFNPQGYVVSGGNDHQIKLIQQLDANLYL